MFVRKLCVFTIFTLSFASNLYAQSSNQGFGTQLNSHIFRFSDSLETVGIEDALEFESERIGYKWAFRASIDHAVDTLIAIDASNNDEVLSYVENIQSLNLGTSYLYRHFLLFGLALPVHSVTLTSQGNTATGGGLGKSTTLGDANIFLKWRLTGKGSKLNFAIMPRIILPTGDSALLVSDGFGFGIRALLSYRARLFKLYSHFGFLSTPDSGFLTVTRAQRLEAAIGALFKITKRIAINAEMVGDVAFGGETGVDQNTVSILAGLRYSFSQKLKLFAGLSINGILEAQAQEFGYYAGLKFAFGQDKEVLKQKAKTAEKEEMQVAFTEQSKKKKATVDKRVGELEYSGFELKDNGQSSVTNVLDKSVRERNYKLPPGQKQPGELEYSGFEIKSNGQNGTANILNQSVLEKSYQVPSNRYQKVRTASGTQYKEIPLSDKITPQTTLTTIQTKKGMLYTPKALAQETTFKKVKTAQGIKYKEIKKQQQTAFQKVKTPQGVAFKEVDSISKPVYQKIKTDQGLVYKKVEEIPDPIIKKVRTENGVSYKQIIEPTLPVYQKVKTVSGIKYKNISIQKVAKFKKTKTDQGVVFTEVPEVTFKKVASKKSLSGFEYKKVPTMLPIFKKFNTAQGTIFKKVSNIPSPIFEEVKNRNGISYRQSSEAKPTYFKEVKQRNGVVKYQEVPIKEAQRIVEKELQEAIKQPIFKKVQTARGSKYKEIIEIPKISPKTKLKTVKTPQGLIYQPQSIVQKPLFKKIKTPKGFKYEKIQTPKFATYKKVKTTNGSIFKEIKSVEVPVYKKMQTQQGLVYKKVKKDKAPIIQRIRTRSGVEYKQVQIQNNPKFKQIRTITGVKYKKVSTPQKINFKKVKTNNGDVFTETIKPIFVKVQDSQGRISYKETKIKNPIFKKFETAQGTIYKQVKEAPKATYKEVQTSRGVTYKKTNDKSSTFFEEVKLANGQTRYQKVSPQKATKALVQLEKIMKPSYTAQRIARREIDDIEFTSQSIIHKGVSSKEYLMKQAPSLSKTKYQRVKTATSFKYQAVELPVQPTFKKVKTAQGIIYKEVEEKTFKKVKTSKGTRYQETIAFPSVFKKIKTPQGIIFKKAAQLIKPPIIKKVQTRQGIKFKQVASANDLKYKKVKTPAGLKYKKVSTVKNIEYKQVDTPEGKVFTEIVKPKYTKVKTSRGTQYKKELVSNPVFKKFETAQGIIYRQVKEVPKAIFKEVVSLNGQIKYEKVQTAPETFFQEVKTLSGQTTYKEISPRLAQEILKPLPLLTNQPVKRIAYNKPIEPLYQNPRLERKVNKEIRQVQRTSTGLPTPIKTDSKGKVIKFTNRTLFRFNKYDLSDEAKRILKKVAKVIRKYERRIGRIQILGHTDTVGTIWYNRYLSEKRAVAVKNYLINIGINPNILDAYGMGEEQPRVSPEITEADRQANRRAEFYFKLLFKKSAPQL